MSNIEIRFNGGKECQNICIPASTGKKRVHLVFTKLRTKEPEDIETMLVDNKIWYECKICGKRYDTFKYTNNHVTVVHKRPKEHLCSFCGKSFTQKYVLVKHLKAHIDRPHQCSMCNRRFDSEEKLKIHHKGQHEGRLRRYQCGDCPKAFLTMQHLKSHVLSHNQEKNFTCGICSQRFIHADTLRRHMVRKHIKSQTFKCDKCPKEYKFKYVLQLHKKNKHNLEEKEEKNEENVESANENQPIVKKEEVLFKERQTEFVCYVCGKVFSKKYFLQNHLLIHSGAKPYTCEVCNKSFRQKGHLQRHQKTHSGERNYQCSYCSKRFTRQEHLIVHEKSLHPPSGMKEVSLSICNICNRSFKTQCLKKHMKTHEPKKYLCSDCGGDFGTESAFKNHIIEGHHFLEPVKTCPICFKEFSRAAHVRRHMINVHASNSFRCNVCGEGYLSEEEFQKHVVKGHGLVGQVKRSKKKKVEKLKSEDEEDLNSLDVLDLLY